MNSKEKAEYIAQILDKKLAEDIVLLNVSNITSITDYYVIATAKNTPHSKSLCDEIEEKLSQKGVNARNIEGYQSAMWILMDFQDVIIHIFYDETRKFYDLERLWSDAERVPFVNDNI